VQDGQKLVPGVTKVFRRDQAMYVYLEATKPAVERRQFLMATVSFYRDGVKTFETAPLQVANGLNAKSKAVPVTLSVPLESLPAGRYTCQVNLVQPSAQKFAVCRSSMVLLP